MQNLPQPLAPERKRIIRPFIFSTLLSCICCFVLVASSQTPQYLLSAPSIEDSKISGSDSPFSSVIASTHARSPKVNLTSTTPFASAVTPSDPPNPGYASAGVSILFQNSGNSTIGTGASILFQNSGGTTLGLGASILFQNSSGGGADRGVSIGFTSNCVISCNATVPTSGMVGSIISFNSSLSQQIACGGGVQYNWNFGDGSARANLSNSTHTYTSAGIYSWTLTVSIPGGTSCVKTGRITISSPSQYCLTTSVVGGGSISISPSGSCFNYGSTVSVTASTNTGYRFNGWSIDGISYSSNPISILMNRNKNIIANFVTQNTSLSGNIGIKDGAKQWELNGPGIISLNVYARPTQGGNILYIANVEGSHYSFPNLPQGTNYDLSIVLIYKDIITINNIIDPPFNLLGCADMVITKTSRLSVHNVSPQSSPTFNINFPPPLVMVHGILSCYNKWYEEGDEINSWDNYARASGFITFTPNYHFDNDYTFAQRATEIKNQIEYNFTRLLTNPDGNFPPWYYIAHSMGGLVARTLASGEHKKSLLINSLRKIYLLGTPNNGTNKAFGAAKLSFLSERLIQGIFNRYQWYPTFGGKAVRAYAGNDGLAWDTKSDGIVPIDSVFNIDQADCSFNGVYWTCTKTHHVMTIPERYLAHYDHLQLGSPDTRQLFFVESILPNICSLSGFDCSPTNPLTKTIPYNLTSIQDESISMKIVDSQIKTLTANETKMVPFTVGASDLLVIDVSVFAGSATFTIINPSGQVIDFNSLPPTDGEYKNNEFGETFAISNPALGIWNLKAVAGTSGTRFKATITEDSLVGFDGFVTQSTIFAGGTAHLQGQWSRNSNAIIAPFISAKINDEAGTTVGTTTLYDDGAHGDGAPSDGIFGGETPVLPTTGRYTVIFTTQGISNGISFTRWAEAYVDVIASSHLFDGNFSDGAYDSDEDGIYDTLQETVIVNIPAEGSYLVSADLEDAQGYFIDHAVGHLQVSAGTYSVSMNFKMSGVICSQFTSPFVIKNLTLSEGGDLKVLDIWTGQINTEPYDGLLFGCMNGTPSPTIIGVQPNSMFPSSSGQVIINGNSFLNGAQVSFGSGVTVSSVTYTNTYTLLAQISVASGATPGLQDVTVTNPDGHSATAIGAFSVATDQPPSVSINNVTNQQAISGIVTVSATATDDVGIQKIEFYVDGTLAGMDTSFPYQFVWDTNALPNGTHTLAAKAYDTINQNATSQINVILSCVSSFSPTNQSFPAEGGNGSINITSASICGWTATSNDAWINITSGSSGNGNGTVNYSVAANSGAARTGTITIAGQIFTVTQDASPTAVTLISFAATGYDGGTFIEWQTGFEVDNLGFNIYREESGKRSLVNQQIVAGSALKAGSSLSSGETYSWWDATPSKTATYWLEDLDLKGRSTMHGPFYAKAVGGAPPARSQASLLSKLGSNDSQNSSHPLETLVANDRRTVQDTMQQANLAGQKAVKILVQHEGWYRVSQKDLIAAGLPKDADPRNLQLYVGGREVPITVSTGSNNTFDESSFIEFYGLGIDTPSTDTNTYWLVAGTQPGKRITQVKGEGVSTSATSFAQTVERKDRSIYFAALLNGDKENFFGAVITSNPVEQTLELRHIAPNVLQQAVVDITLQGVTVIPHRVLAQLNGISLGEVIFTGEENKSATFTAPHSILSEGANVIRLISQNGTADVSLVDSLRISYQHTFSADSDFLKFPIRGGEATTITGFSSKQVRVFDVTTPESPQELLGKIAEERNGYSIAVAPQEHGERILLALADSQVKQPASLMANTTSTLRDANNQADLVVITSGSLRNAIAPLKEARQSEGYRVLVADIEDIYDEFNFGNKSPQAIKDFLVYAKTNWKVAPRFVLLVGDASYDAKNYLGLGDFDLVPTKLIDTNYLETASDDWFVDFNDDGLPELAIGRLPVRDTEEAASLVAKILRYSKAKSPLSALLVSDRNDGFNFEQTNTNVRALLEPSLKVEEVRRSQFDDATAKTKLLESLNRGQRFVNYVGHGSVNLWRGNLLTSTDARNLTNDALPVFVTMNCLNGYFQEATTDSLSEALLKSERGGAIAVWASSGLTSPEEQAVINQQFYRLLFDAKVTSLTLGEAAAKAKAATANPYIRRTWVLLGDPTMRIN